MCPFPRETIQHVVRVWVWEAARLQLTPEQYMKLLDAAGTEQEQALLWFRASTQAAATRAQSSRGGSVVGEDVDSGCCLNGRPTGRC